MPVKSFVNQYLEKGAATGIKHMQSLYSAMKQDDRLDEYHQAMENEELLYSLLKEYNLITIQ